MSTKMDKETMNYFTGLLVEQKTSFKETMDEQMKALTKNNNDNTEQIKKITSKMSLRTYTVDLHNWNKDHPQHRST